MAIENLEVYANTTYNMSYTHVEPMTGGTVYFTVKSVRSDTDATDSDATPKKTITTFSNGDLLASWVVDDSDMYITPGTYYYNIIFEDSDGLSLPPAFEGKFKVLPNVANRQVGNE